MKDILFLLTPGFRDGEGAPYYCPHCTIMEGVLHLFPVLQEKLEVRRVDFPRPRPDIVSLLGTENQSCPVLILADSTVSSVEGQFEVRTYQDRRFIDDVEGIGNYLSSTYGTPRPH